jgi:hypothetical protein
MENFSEVSSASGEYSASDTGIIQQSGHSERKCKKDENSFLQSITGGYGTVIFTRGNTLTFRKAHSHSIKHRHAQ